MRLFKGVVSILILLDYLFLFAGLNKDQKMLGGFNPYFIGLPILILVKKHKEKKIAGFNPYFIGLPILICRKINRNFKHLRVSILILLDYLFLYYSYHYQLKYWDCFNPYFIGLPILI